MMSYKVSVILAVALAATCLIAVSADQTARKKELKTKLFGDDMSLNSTEVLPLLKELQQINAEELAKLPADSTKITAQQSEVKILDGILKQFIAAGEVNQEQAKDKAFVQKLVHYIESELEHGVYFNMHPYLEIGLKAWQEASKQ